jgi:hypothetical protein
MAEGVVVGRPFGNANARRHGAFSRDLETAVEARLAELPAYLRAAAFADAVQIVFRRVERAQRLGEWVGGLSEAEACTPRKAGGSSPEEISRHADDSALRGLNLLGMSPAAAAKSAHRLEMGLRPDYALLAMEAGEDGIANLADGG